MLRALGVLLARLFVKLRFLVVLAWLGGAGWLSLTLPPISGQEQTSFSALVPPHAPAITAERVSASRFASPLLARTIGVIRNPHGLSGARQSQIVLVARRLSMGVGLLIDAFLVRTLLVPALVALVGRASAWPGPTLRRAPAVTLSKTPQPP
jgi:uncharacterized membrane protein YdfJ with MMPL/SSD domain